MNTPSLEMRGSPRLGAPEKAQATDVEVASVSTDTRTPIRIGFWMLLVGFGGFLAWAAYAPLDEGVAAQANVAIETHRRTIQHMVGGVVSKVFVKEGQTVHAGDVVIELDHAAAQANYEMVRQNYLGQRAAESRLVAELSDLPQIEFHRSLTENANDPLVRQHITVQNQLFASRRAALKAELDAAKESIGGFEAQLAGISAMIESRRTQARLQNEQIASVRELSSEGYAPRNQLLQLEQAQAELRTQMEDLNGNRARVLKQIAELKLRTTQRIEEYHKEVNAQLAEVRREVQGGQDRLIAVREELQRTQIRTPVDGQIVGLAVTAVGGVVTPGQRLMDVVPKGEGLLIDAKIPPHVIDRVRLGNPADVRFSAFAHSPQLVVEGKLVSLSTDAVTESVGNMVATYYLGRIEVTPRGVQELGNRVMQPGMPAEVIIRSGERSLLTYLLHPLTKRIAASMKEE